MNRLGAVASAWGGFAGEYRDDEFDVVDDDDLEPVDGDDLRDLDDDGPRAGEWGVSLRRA